MNVELIKSLHVLTQEMHVLMQETLSMYKDLIPRPLFLGEMRKKFARNEFIHCAVWTN